MMVNGFYFDTAKVEKRRLTTKKKDQNLSFFIKTKPNSAKLDLNFGINLLRNETH